ncbi:hypothetical protein M0805_002967 [Coniferiporia weirii]|nr:hypothetical protein M0805_002967 [Coniferiporia weirii]
MMSGPFFAHQFLSSESALVKREGGFRFQADPRTVGDLSIWCIFDLIYIVITLLCLQPIRRLRAHRTPFLALCATSFFTVVQASVDIANIIFTNNALEIPNVNKVAALQSIVVFFGNWSSPLLYFALVLLLFDRQRYISRGALVLRDVLVFNTSFGFFGFLMLLATITSGLFARQDALQARLLNLGGTSTPEDFQALISAVQRYQNAFYVFTAFWAFSAVWITGLAGYVYWGARRAGAYDRISKIMLYAVTPLYILGMMQTVVFTIYFSPAVVIKTQTELENLDLANDVLNNAIYSTIMAIVLVLGFKRAFWNASDQGVALTSLRALSPGGYAELVEPPLQK